MIGRLTGVLVEKRPPELLVDVGGVGYELEAPLSTFAQLPAQGETCRLFTQLVVREDAHLLFGFATERERYLFRSLTRVSGVGAKLALAVLSGMEPTAFTACIAEGDVTRLTRLPGIGKKTAERLIVEMRDRLGAEAGAVVTGAGGAAGAPGAPATPVADAIAGLVALGYKSAEAERYVREVSTEGRGSEEIIRDVLKRLVR